MKPDVGVEKNAGKTNLEQKKNARAGKQKDISTRSYYTMDRTCLADTKTIRGQWWICNVSENGKFHVVESRVLVPTAGIHFVSQLVIG